MTKNTINKEVNNAPNWEARINVVCQKLRIPDLGSRSGLKKVHKAFPGLYGKLSTCYRENAKHSLVLGTIVNIYARMCTDALLRDKLLREGFLTQVLPLLDTPACQMGALKCLVSLSHHGGAQARITLAKQTPKLLKIAQDNIRDDPLVSEQCLVVISHAATLVLSSEVLDAKEFKNLGDLVPLVEFIDDFLRKPTTGYSAFSHAHHFLSGAALHARSAFLAHPNSISFLMACLRSKDLQTRAMAMSGILRLQISVSKVESRFYDPRRMVEKFQKGDCPQVMSDALMQYGFERAETVATIKASVDYQKAMMKCAQDHDMYALGMKLFEIIGRTEFSVADGMFQDEYGMTIDLGLPFVRWLDAMPHCARAIRERGIPSQQDAADVIELKYFIVTSRSADLHKLAKECLQRSPGVAFYYYAMTMDSENAEGLRWAKKGLRCTGPSQTPYVRFGLLFNAVEHAGLLGLQVLEQASKGERAWEEGFAILRCAFEDSKAYVAEAPPDSRHMSTAIMWCTLLNITLRGSDLSPDLREIQPLMEKQKVADEIKLFLHFDSLVQTQFRLARAMILKYYSLAAAEWGPIINRFDDMEDTPSQAIVLSRSADEELSAWLDGINIDEDGEEEAEKIHRLRSSSDDKTLELYRCSSCRNPSAMLKKCMRCAKARYCDTECQKMHWPEHKKICKPKAT